MTNDSGRFAQELNRLMADHEPPMSINELSGALGLTYEFCRKLVRGLALPTQQSVLLLANVFGVPSEEMSEWVRETKLGSLIGNDVAVMLFNPETKTLVSSLGALTAAQRREVLSLVLKHVKTNSKQAEATALSSKKLTTHGNTERSNRPAAF